jgi:hypothetical protein
VTATGKYFASLYPNPNFNDPNNLYNYVYQALEPTNRTDFKSRFDWNISNKTKAYVRVAHETEYTESARGVWWAPPDVVALPTPNVGEHVGRSYAGNVVTVLSPSMTNEVVVSYSRLTLDNRYKDPSILKQERAASRSTGFSLPERPVRICRMICCTVGELETARSVSCGRRRTTCMRITMRCSSATSSRSCSGRTA